MLFSVYTFIATVNFFFSSRSCFANHKRTAFKFISSIIQYKVPFYTSYFVSILKLFLTKTNKIKDVDLSKLDAKKISLLFEDGSIYDDYSKMIDYGISNDLIMKLHENQISIENLKTGEFSKSDFDEYELLLIEEFLQIA